MPKQQSVALALIKWLDLYVVINLSDLRIGPTSSAITYGRLLYIYDWVIFFKMWFHFLMLFTLCAIVYMKLVQYNECLVSIMDTDGLAL